MPSRGRRRASAWRFVGAVLGSTLLLATTLAVACGDFSPDVGALTHPYAACVAADAAPDAREPGVDATCGASSGPTY